MGQLEIVLDGPHTFLSHQGQPLLRVPTQDWGNVDIRLESHVVTEWDEGDFRWWFEVRAREAVRIERWPLFPPSTWINAYEVHNYRNRHYTERTTPDLILGEACETSTYSDDWQFAPHPSWLAFSQWGHAWIIGVEGTPPSYGLHLSARHYDVERFELEVAPIELAKGETLRSPVFRLRVQSGREVERLCTEFAHRLFPTPERARHWVEDPLYCTWFDQVFSAQAEVKSDLHDQLADPTWDACTEALKEALVWQAVDRIERYGLPIRTILLDVGWFRAIGDWRVHSERFPDFERLVDQLHERGFRVVVWWHWGDVDARAEVDPELLAGRGAFVRHGRRLFDYSNPRTREDYLPTLFQHLFGQIGIDGVKTDFLADKIHPSVPFFDPTWAGEENYFVRVTQTFHECMRSFKPDAAHIGASGHPALAPYLEINRTYDVHSTNPREHQARTRMLRATCPVVPVAFDFHPWAENQAEYFELARAERASVQVGNLLKIRDHLRAPVRDLNETDYARIRDGLVPPTA